MSLDWLVGEGALTVLCEELREYIRVYTVDKRYVGRFDYLQKYVELCRVLQK